MKVSLTLVLLFSCFAQAADWPTYLGPEKNGIVQEKVRTDWSKEAPKVLWKADLGRGCSSFAVADGLVLTMGNSGKIETIWCFVAATGKIKWKDSYEEDLAPKFYTGGPGATPTIDGDRVYTLSKSGRLNCYELSTGTLQWTQHLKDDLGGKPPTWGYSTAPFIDGEELLVMPCGKGSSLVALDKKTGKELWKSAHQARAGYTLPVLANYRGAKTAFIFHGRNLAAYNLEKKGELLFEFEWRTPYDVNATSPVFYEDMLYIASGYGMGYAVLDLSGKEPKILHRDRERRMIFQNAILKKGDLIGVFGDKNIDAEAFRMDMKTGKLKWSVKIPGTRASTLMAGDQLIILSESGELIFGKDTGTAFQETSRHQILKKLCWAAPAISEGRLFVRNNGGEMVCLDLSK
ncbi:PQQ-like beta-propeller repeat protein [Akkermansiaceae bacterium]|nr:PQQ-like beta-propeller repeat protein [Akkermansiaceae bacterium]